MDEYKEKEFTDKEWASILFMLFWDDMAAKDKAWSEFENELVYENRFSSTHPIVNEIELKSDEARINIKENTILYRARIFDQSQFMRLVTYYLENEGLSKNEISMRLNSINDWEKYFELLPDFMSIFTWKSLINNSRTSPIVTAYKKWKNLKYKGYDSQNSIAPPADSIGAGRANPDHIRYLYLSEDPETPVYEVRPMIGQTISIARFKVKKDLTLYDLTAQLQDKYENPDYELPSLFNSIGKMFSKPYNGQPKEYIPTQYLTEKIKNMGFDGIRFKSSLNHGGFNIVLFSDEFCKPYASDLVTVKKIELDIQKPAIYRLFDTSSVESKI